MEKLGQLAARGPVGPDRRGHPAEPLRAGLPGRAAADVLRAGRPDDPDALRRRRGPAAGACARSSAPGSCCSPRPCRRSSAGSCWPTRRRSCRPSTAMFGGFRERAATTYELLRSPGTAFVVVAAPEPDALREASYFVERLAAESMPLAGLVVNRTHPVLAGLPGGEGAGRGRRAGRARGRAAGRGGAAAARGPGGGGRAGDAGCSPGSPRRTRRVPVVRRARRCRPTCTTSTVCARSASGWPASRLGSADADVLVDVGVLALGVCRAVRARTSRPAGDAAEPAAHARSSRPRRRTRSGCPAPRPGTPCAPGTRCTPAWPCAAPCRGRTTRPDPRRGTSALTRQSACSDCPCPPPLAVVSTS